MTSDDRGSNALISKCKRNSSRPHMSTKDTSNVLTIDRLVLMTTQYSVSMTMTLHHLNAKGIQNRAAGTSTALHQWAVKSIRHGVVISHAMATLNRVSSAPPEPSHAHHKDVSRMLASVRFYSISPAQVHVHLLNRRLSDSRTTRIS
jgi:hypothetical protein